MMKCQDLENLLEQGKFEWVKQQLLPLFGLLDYLEEEGNGFFSLPLSKENLIRNLHRITRKHESIIKQELREFEENFRYYIEVKEETYRYSTGITTRTHPPPNYPCSTRNQEFATKYYILKPTLVNYSKDSLKNLDFDSAKFFNEIRSNVHTVEDLLFLYLLRQVTERCKSQDYYSYEVTTEYDLTEIMEIAGIDQEIIEYAFFHKNYFDFSYKNMKRFLPRNEFIFATFYLHDFNTSSCMRKNNISIEENLARYLSKKLGEIPFNEYLRESYGKVKQQLQKKVERIPLFAYKDHRYKFIVKYGSNLTNEYSKLFDFEIEEEKLIKALKYFIEKGIIEIRDDEVILSSEEKFHALSSSLGEKESERITKNKRELLLKWLRSGIRLEEEEEEEEGEVIGEEEKEMEMTREEEEEQTISEDMLVGFECGTGEAVRIKPAHLFISGVTQKSGKTTTLEALIQRSGLSAISFITKPGEKCFEKGNYHKAFFQEKAEWKVVERLFESQLGERMRDVRPKLIELCKHEKTYQAIKQSIDDALDEAKGSEKRSLILLQAYFEDLFEELKDKDYTNALDLKKGINLMDLTDFNQELQSYIINGVMNEILHKHEEIIVLVPEAWKFIPQFKRTPCKYSIEQLIRQGATKHNFVWFDSQDIAGVDKTMLKNVSIWLLGLQTEKNEVEHTIKQIPLPKAQKPTDDQIMRLETGEFFVCADGRVKKTYVMPNWLGKDKAINVAKSKQYFGN